MSSTFTAADPIAPPLASPLHADETWSLSIRATKAEAKKLSAIVSPTRNFEPTAQRGVYAMTSNSELLTIRDADFLANMGVEVLSIENVR